MMNSVTINLPRILLSGFSLSFIAPKEGSPHAIVDPGDGHDEIMMKLRIPMDVADDPEELSKMEDELMKIAISLNDYGRRLDKHSLMAQLEKT